MSVRFDIDLTLPLHDFVLAVSWATDTEALGIFGPSGSGKTTTLAAIAGLRPQATGRISIADRVWLDTAGKVALPPERRGVGYVPQDLLLFPHLPVRGHLEAGSRRVESDPSRALDPARVIEVLDLAALLDRDVASLSGGEQRRVALARALCSAPEFLLLDEPLAGLDDALRRRILGYLLRIRDEFGLPTLVVTHDPFEIQALCDEAILLDRGRVIARGSPIELLHAPSFSSFSPTESLENLLRGQVLTVDETTAEIGIDDRIRVLVPRCGLTPGEQALIGLRAADLIVAVGSPVGLSAQNVVPATLDAVDESGTLIARIGARNEPITAAITARACAALGLARGQAVHLVFKTNACRVIPAGRRREPGR